MYPQNPYGNPYISPYAMQAYNMDWASPNFVVPTGNADLDMLTQAVQYEASTFPPGFGGMQHFMAHNASLMDQAYQLANGQNMPNPGMGGQGGDLPASAGGERSTGRRLLGAGATAAVAGLGAYALLNCWNPTGWAAGTVALGVAAVGAIAGFFM